VTTPFRFIEPGTGSSRSIAGSLREVVVLSEEQGRLARLHMEIACSR
jgi:hypothetical protein